MNHLDRIRAEIKDMTPEQRTEYFAKKQADREAKANADKVAQMRACADALRGTHFPGGVWSALKFSTEMLEADVLVGGTGIMTHSAQARELLRLDTTARRDRADSEAYTLGNLQGGRHSDCLNRAVSALLSMIEKGTEGEEMYAERVARQQREREADLRKVLPGAVYHHPAMRRD